MYLFNFQHVYKSFSPVTFFVYTFLLLFQRIRNQHKILRFFILILKKFGKTFFGHFSTFCKPLSQTRKKRRKKRKMYFTNVFFIHLWVRTFNFLKKSLNRWSLLYSLLCSDMAFDGMLCWVMEAMVHRWLSYNVFTVSGGYSNWRKCNIMAAFLEIRGLLKGFKQ